LGSTDLSCQKVRETSRGLTSSASVPKAAATQKKYQYNYND